LEEILMFKVKLRTITVFLAIGIAAASFAGCTARKTDNLAKNFDKEIVFPLEKPYTLSYWVPIYGGSGTLTSYDDMAMYKEYEKATNVHIDFIHPVIGSETEQFNVMLASGEYPDMIDGFDARYNGKSTKGYEDGIIIALNDLLKLHAPNLSNNYEKISLSLLPYVLNEQDLHLGVPLIYGGRFCARGAGPIIQRWIFLKKEDLKSLKQLTSGKLL
jgi:ABC-type glycerol-3-phosphate transport system substrate-binding protein